MRLPGSGRTQRLPGRCRAVVTGGLHSHGLAHLAVTEAVRGSFDATHAVISARCGKVIGKRQIEQMVTSAAADIDAFYAAQTPLPRTAEELLVISVDGKGVVMRPEALRPRPGKPPPAARAPSAPAWRPGRNQPKTHGHPGRGPRRRTHTAPSA